MRLLGMARLVVPAMIILFCVYVYVVVVNVMLNPAGAQQQFMTVLLLQLLLLLYTASFLVLLSPVPLLAVVGIILLFCVVPSLTPRDDPVRCRGDRTNPGCTHDDL